MKKTMLIPIIVLVVALVAGILVWRQVSKPILIGVILPLDKLTGNEANLFMRYYQAKNPKIGLRPVRFVIEDRPSEEQAVRTAYAQLNAQGAAAIIGGNLSSEGIWLAEESAKSGIPTFGITPSTAVLSGKKDGFFRLCPTNASQAKAVSLYFQQQGVNRLVVVTSLENTVYVEPFFSVLAESFPGELIRIPFAPEEDNPKKVLDANPEGIFTILPAKDVIYMIKAIRELRPEIKFGSSSWGSDEILSLYSGPLLDGVFFFALDKTLYGADYQAELEDFGKTYNMKVTNAAQYTVSLLHLLYAAIKEVGASRAALKAYFETPRVYETCYGPTPMDEFGDVSARRIIVQETVNGILQKKEVVELP